MQWAYGHGMSNDLQLYYAPDNASLCVRLLLERLNITYETVLVDRTLQGQKAAAYRALNPNGLIPTLITPYGPMFETGAILVWIADQHPGQVFPKLDDPERAAALTWMFWISNTLHPTLRHIFYADQYAPDPKGLRAMAKIRACANLDIAENACGVIKRYDALSCYLVPTLRWLMLYGGRPGWLTLERWPKLSTLAQEFEGTAFAKNATIAEGLGATPFTQPEHPTPPEGSAT